MGKGKRKGPSSFFLNIWDRLTELCLILKRLSQGEERKEIELVSSERWKEDVKVGIWTHGSLRSLAQKAASTELSLLHFPTATFFRQNSLSTSSSDAPSTALVPLRLPP